MGKKKESTSKFFILFIFAGYFHLVPQGIIFFLSKNISVSLPLFICFNLSMMAFYLYIFLCLFNLGHVEKNEEMDGLLFKTSGKRYCNKCDNYKPERSHHCRRCGVCVKKMDHHCEWLTICIGNDNHGHFIRLLFFSLLSLAILIVWILIFVPKYIIKKQKHCIFYSVILLVHVLLLLSTFIIIAIFFYERLKQITQNMTYIESERYKDMLMYGINCRKSPYDFGVWKNLEQVLGKPYFLYLFGEKSDGITFPKTYEIEGDWPPYKFHCADEYNALV